MKAEELVKDIQETARDHAKIYDKDSMEHYGKAILCGGAALVLGIRAIWHYGYCAFLGGAQKELERLDHGIDEHKE